MTAIVDAGDRILGVIHRRRSAPPIDRARI